MKLYIAISFGLIVSLTKFHAQTTDSVWRVQPTISITGFVDAFYVYDFNQPNTNYRQKFLYNHNRHNEFNINLGLVKFAVNHEKYRANLGFQAGTYITDNYASEASELKNISEANIGLSLSKKNRLWLDAGIMGSHIGFESAISIENPTLTRSLLAENSPYFLTGAKLSYIPSSNLEMAVLAVNGWQKIQRVPGNSLMSFGTQVKYSKSKKFNLNWSTFVGTIDPDTKRRMRYFNNLYAIFKPANNLKLIAGMDVGLQQHKKNSERYNYWYTPVFITQVKLKPHLNAALRLEYFNDENGIIVPTITPNGFKTIGASINLDYNPISNLSLRVEGRLLTSQDLIFYKNGISTNNNFCFILSMAYKISKSL